MTPDLHIRFPLGAAVRKISGPEWQGVVVGYYSSSFTPEGLVIECTAPGARGQVHVEPAKRMERAMTQTPDLDYPVANPPDIAPIIFRAMILQAMAMQYFNYMRDAPEGTAERKFEAAGLVFAFTDQSPSYCAGFEAGMVWQRMQAGEAEIDLGFLEGFPVRHENLETFARMAAAAGYRMEHQSSGYEGWEQMRMVAAPKAKPSLVLVGEPT